jgi:hypothetical protein
VRHALAVAGDVIGKAFAARGFKPAAGICIGLEPELFPTSQIGHQRQRQARGADAIAAKHAPGDARPDAGQQFTAVDCKVVFGSGHGATLAQARRNRGETFTKG